MSGNGFGTSVGGETLMCLDCQVQFEFSDAEKQFYAREGSKHPQYCLDCRERRRQERNAGLLRHHESGETESGWSEHPGHFGGGASSGRSGASKSGRSKAICSGCGGEAIVPFIPRRGRPVYCQRCFAQRKSQPTRNR